jgi:hypothetical protein
VTDLYDRLGDIVDDMDLDADPEKLEFQELTTDQGTGSEVETQNLTWVKPFNPGEDFVGDETRTLALEDGSQLAVTIQKRIQCPSCSHVLADDGEPQHLSGECSTCGVETCHRCQNTCAACGTILCDEHSHGHGVKDETYCRTHRGDVEEDLEFDRDLQQLETQHSQRMDELEHELKKKEKEKKLELQEERQEKEQVRKDWKLILDQLRDGDEDDEEEEKKGGDLFGGDSLQPDGDAFTGSGAFTEGKEYHDSNGDIPDWLENEFSDLED